MNIKAFTKKICCLLAATLIFSLFFALPASAATTTLSLSSKQVKKGENVTVTVKLNAGEAIYGFDITVTYDTSVLKYVSGAGSESGGKLKIVDALNGETSYSKSIVFSAIAEGSAKVSASALYSGSSLNEVSGGSGSATVTVKAAASATTSTVSQTPSQPSTNANLSALGVDGGTLSPAFSKNVTDYSVTVDNYVASTNINATAADKNAKLSGNGAVELQIGDNQISVTVTAADGTTKKTYNITVHRSSIDETLASNPLAVPINGEIAYIQSDLSLSEPPQGFTVSTAVYKGTDIGVLTSESGEYTLYLLNNPISGQTDYYVYNDLRDEFSLLSYLTVGDKLYIFAALPEERVVPNGWYETAVTLGNTNVTAFCSEDGAMKDIYLIYCYCDGKEQFFRYDMTDGSIQRAPDFTVTANSDSVSGNGIKGVLNRFNSLDKPIKIMVVSLAGSAVLIIALAIAVIVLAATKKTTNRYDDSVIFGNDDFSALFSPAEITATVETSAETDTRDTECEEINNEQ